MSANDSLDDFTSPLPKRRRQPLTDNHSENKLKPSKKKKLPSEDRTEPTPTWTHDRAIQVGGGLGSRGSYQRKDVADASRPLNHTRLIRTVLVDKVCNLRCFSYF